MKKFIAVLCLLPVFAHADFSIESLNYQDSASVQALIQEASDRLPDSFKQNLNNKVTIAFKPLNRSGKVIWGQVMAIPGLKKKASHIDLNVDLLKEENSHKMLPTLLHEMTHLYDFRTKVSDDQVFLNIAGWQKKKITRRVQQRNKNQNRRVDIYEDANPKESLAVNMEHFLLDPEYKCRKPSLYNYLSEKLDTAPFENFECQTEYKLAPTISFEGIPEKQKVLDPERLYEVHYFFAGEGKQMMSRWGHAMLRLVMCAPGRKVVDEKCLQDRAHHLVISFRADITNFNIDYMKGLTGKYTSKMFLLSMSEVIKEYTVGELRHLYSIPLKMDENQKKRFVNLVLENHWGYGSKYYFVTNNCADETLNLIRNVYPENLKMVNLNVLTPLGIRKKFEELGISDMSVFEDLESAKKSGHFFESLHAKLERIVEELKDRKIIGAKYKSHLEVLDTTREEREAMLNLASNSDDIGKLVFIEDTIMNRKLLNLQQAIGKTLYEQDNAGEGKFLELYRELEEVRERRSGLDLSHGYGIPQQSDSIFKEVIFTEEDEENLKETQQSFISEIARLFSKEQKELESIYLQKQLLLQKLKQAYQQERL